MNGNFRLLHKCDLTSLEEAEEADFGSSMGGREERLFCTPLDGSGGGADEVDLEEMLEVRGGGTGLAVGLADLIQA